MQYTYLVLIKQQKNQGAFYYLVRIGRWSAIPLRKQINEDLKIAFN